MLAAFLCGYSYIGFTDRERVIPFATDYFKAALLGWGGESAKRLSQLMQLFQLIGNDPCPVGTTLVTPVTPVAQGIFLLFILHYICKTTLLALFFCII